MFDSHINKSSFKLLIHEHERNVYSEHAIIVHIIFIHVYSPIPTKIIFVEEIQKNELYIIEQVIHFDTITSSHLFHSHNLF